MPAAYAHMTLVNELARSRPRLEGIEGLDRNVKLALGQWLSYVELGAVSPDYPYLAVHSNAAKRWADLMHLGNTGPMIAAGIEAAKDLPDATKPKVVAWLCGYAAHVGMDMTIHPVVELKVGPYEQNKTQHRVCEMHQDVYIYQRLNLGEIGLGEHLDSGVRRCRSDEGGLDEEIAQFWLGMFRRSHPGEVESNPPAFDTWHRCFGQMVDKIAEEGHSLLPWARHVAADCGMTYESFDNLDRQYIDNLQVPGGGRAGYDDIYERAITNVGNLWRLISEGVYDGGESYRNYLTVWNLDTGRDANGRLVMWG